MWSIFISGLKNLIYCFFSSSNCLTSSSHVFLLSANSSAVRGQTILLSLKHTHATSYLLQVLRQRQCGARQLDELYIGTVKAFSEQIDIHQHLYVGFLFQRGIARLTIIISYTCFLKPFNVSKSGVLLLIATAFMPCCLYASAICSAWAMSMA